MHISPLVILLGWIPAGAYLFRRLPVRIAILANFLGGWAILPGASYQATPDNFPYWILGVCLPTNYFLTKATATGLAALAGFLLFHFADLRTFKPGFCDLPMAVWCCVPLLSAAAPSTLCVPLWLSALPLGGRSALYRLSSHRPTGGRKSAGHLDGGGYPAGRLARSQ